jgi:transcriptional regulator
MYCPSSFSESRPDILFGLIAQYPLATLIRQTDEGLVADHVPLLYQPASKGAGQLIGHVAKSNPLWQTPSDAEVLAIFQGPSRYISPNWYASKQDRGEVVPTWNYAVVHAQCRLTATHEAARVLADITALTDQQEKDQPHPWKVADAPAAYTEKLSAHIVGIELSILRIEGKWKVSQNQPARNQASVVEGLRALGTPEADAMAALVSQRSRGGPVLP